MVIADNPDPDGAAGHDVMAALAQVCTLDLCGAVQRWSVVKRLLASAIRTLELADGVRLELPLTRNSARAVADFVRVERECCARFSYSAAPNAKGQTLQLDIRARGDDVAALKTLYLALRR